MELPSAGGGPVHVQLTGEAALNDTGHGYWTAFVELQVRSSTVSATYKVTLQNVGSGWLLFDMAVG